MVERDVIERILAHLEEYLRDLEYEGMREPLDHKDCFQVLSENRVIPQELRDRLKKMAQFRNVVVYDYIRINPEIVYTIVQNNISDIVAFAQHIDKEISG